MQQGDLSDLVEFFQGLSFDDIPPPVLRAATDSLVNVAGVAIGGLDEDATQRALRATGQLDSGSLALIVGSGERRSADHAALVQGIAAHVLDFDDTDLATIYHPSCAVHGAVWSLLEMTDTGGEQMLLAWVTGLEVGMRLAGALGMPHYDRGWHVTGTAGPVAAAASACVLLRATEDQLARALNIAATSSAGHRVHFGYDTKSGHAGLAAQHGVLAAVLAREGFTASSQGVTGTRGLLGVIGAGGRSTALTDGLGVSWRILDNRIKPYASGVVTHPTIDLARTIGATCSRSEQDLSSVDLFVHPLVGELTNIDPPASGLQGKFSVRHCFAAGFLTDGAGPAEFQDDAVTDPRFASLRDRVHVQVTPEIEHMTACADVRFADGRTERFETGAVRGTEARPLTSEEIRDKFVSATRSRLRTADATKWFERLLEVASIESTSALVRDLDAALGASPVDSEPQGSERWDEATSGKERS